MKKLIILFSLFIVSPIWADGHLSSENEVMQLANDLGPDGIRVNAISAGPLDTLSSRVISGYRDMKKAHLERAPMKRNITHEEVASTALYLCSDMSSGVTGEVVHVDTGYHVMGI